ncbi:sulfotransferase family 2 domain-containing protein [Phaeobacter inhibens]|uniref:sulfotransferase family 2 domain-containing protein n=1 Tax=Phaeobacter inhibens TaxID=221822 RepID=UPI000CA2770B|nr:sulfotransferase family 2 domain-containing protein [Phaeobacter inhibens]AUQ68766.1 hypothetical protein PhaeoP78_03950 [Phaeobacter inhibens]
MPEDTQRDGALSRLQPGGFALVHVGKTGGTSLRLMIKDLRAAGFKMPLTKLQHKVTPDEALAEQPDLQLGFVYRDPATRFVSGFNSRLRSGRPTHNSIWSPAEAVAFSWFSDANSLAEALYAEDPRLQSAAHFAMSRINHLARGYTFYFQSPEHFRRLQSKIYCLCELSDLNDRAWEFFAPFDNIPKEEVLSRIKQSHSTPGTSTPLSDLAQDNLQRFWDTEYQLYNCFRELDAARRQAGAS